MDNSVRESVDKNMNITKHVGSTPGNFSENIGHRGQRDQLKEIDTESFFEPTDGLFMKKNAPCAMALRLTSLGLLWSVKRDNRNS